jgi:hypothetical protein
VLGKARGTCVTILLGRYQHANQTDTSQPEVVAANKTENKTASDRRREKDDQIESHQSGSLKTLVNGSDNRLGNSRSKVRRGTHPERLARAPKTVENRTKTAPSQNFGK